MTRTVLLSYYAATAVFLSLDWFLGINIRLSFLEDHAGLRSGYYLFCFLCLAVMLWRPALTVLVGAVESLLTLVALIIHMGLRTMLVTEQMIETGEGFVTMAEIVNFMLAGGIAYVAWLRGVRESGLAR